MWCVIQTSVYGLPAGYDIEEVIAPFNSEQAAQEWVNKQQTPKFIIFLIQQCRDPVR